MKKNINDITNPKDGLLSLTMDDDDDETVDDCSSSESDDASAAV